MNGVTFRMDAGPDQLLAADALDGMVGGTVLVDGLPMTCVGVRVIEGGRAALLDLEEPTDA